MTNPRTMHEIFEGLSLKQDDKHSSSGLHSDDSRNGTMSRLVKNCITSEGMGVLSTSDKRSFQAYSPISVTFVGTAAE